MTSTPLSPKAEPVAIVGLEILSPVRSRLDEEHIVRLADVLPSCPPVIVTVDGLLIDGAHRLAATQLLGWQYILAEVVSVDSSADVLLAAAAANSRHGLPLTTSERRAAVERLVEYDPSLSDRVLAGACGVSRSVVEAARARRYERSGGRTGHVNRRKGADGKCYPATPHPANAKVAEALVRLCPELTVRELAQQLVVSVGTAHRLRAAALEGISKEGLVRRVLNRVFARFRLWRFRRLGR